MSQSSSKQYVAETNNRKATLNAVSGSGLQEVQSRYLRRGVSGGGGGTIYIYIYRGSSIVDKKYTSVHDEQTKTINEVVFL